MFQEQRSIIEINLFLFTVQLLKAGQHIKQTTLTNHSRRMGTIQSSSSDLSAIQMLSIVPGRNPQYVCIVSLPVLQTAFHQHMPSEQLFIKNNIAQSYEIEIGVRIMQKYYYGT